ncbi:hypothetical protein KVR01_006954 [Diaporthe batatas]|uniref:uncharacterized protein n=1 Tax=Diaporthe batatas TaxID=748121 RepID=UPI001D04F6C4|nr:uncharacterized protein KVR01_006954 [Diaporthe batatas]KAG8163657.1 hypothetical protein KVR01_006954 [Diaporthe batatas]
MHFTMKTFGAALALAGASQAGPVLVKRQDVGFGRFNASIEDFGEHAHSVALSRLAANSTCTADKISVRKSWHNLNPEERVAYTDAVLCLQSKEAKTPSNLAEGAKTRFDDWIVTHINQTFTIHQTANFLGWHRWFIWEHEQALRNECGYEGTLPYWDWARTAEEGLANSPLFDGSATSLSGDGAPLNYTADDKVVINAQFGAAIVNLPPGTGGGCVTSGPFVNYTVNLGPSGLATLNGATDNSSFPYKHNPRCLKRSLTDYANQRFANSSSVLSLLREPQDIYSFELMMQGDPRYPELGVHGGGHFSIGGDPGRDVFVSPGDPAFYLHHAEIDRVWWLWQMQDPETRIADWTSAVNGPLTMANMTAPFGNGTAQDVQELGFIAEGRTHLLGELLDASANDFCYVYV